MGVQGVQVAAAVEHAAPRAFGLASLSTKRVGLRSGIDRFRATGSAAVAFPRHPDHVEAILINTSGGLTGGDHFEIEARAGADSTLVLTNQSAERVYRRMAGEAQMRARLAVEQGATLYWLPQELILFDGSALDRDLTLDIAPDAEAIVADSVIFGREAMGEDVREAEFHDRVEIRRDGVPVWIDRIEMRGDIARRLARPAVADAARAMASVIYAGPRADRLCGTLRKMLPALGGVSMPRPNLLTLRLLALDGFHLRKTLIPVLRAIANTDLPRSWSL